MNQMTFKEFQKVYTASKEEILLKIFENNQNVIQIKKAKTAIKNLALIFNATLKLSNQGGFQAMTLRQLSAESGIGLGTLYSYIENKEHLASMIVNYVVHSLHILFAISEREYTNPKEQLMWIIRAHVYLTEQLQPWFFFAFLEARHFQENGKTAAKGGEMYTEKMIADCIERGIEDGYFRERDPLMTASIIKPLLQDWYVKSWKYKYRKISVEEYVDHTTDLIQSYICKPE
jgi:AcrR family transcriptional regulator